jgi:alkylhydroperoxidase family enzyme
MILRTCARCGAEYEWGVHVAAFGAKAQWTEEQKRSTVRGRAADSCWTPEDRLVISLADELHDTSAVSEPLWQELAAHFAPEQILELLMLAGLYHGVSYLINGARVQGEDFAPGFP